MITTLHDYAVVLDHYLTAHHCPTLFLQSIKKKNNKNTTCYFGDSYGKSSESSLAQLVQAKVTDISTQHYHWSHPHDNIKQTTIGLCLRFVHIQGFFFLPLYKLTP